MQGKFTIYFEDPFWVGVAEVIDNEKYRLGKVVFSDEPSSAEIYEFSKEQYSKIKFKEIDIDNERINKKVNPKRMIREVKKQQDKKGIGTKSQLALKKIQESNKIEKKKLNKEKKIELQKNKFLAKQIKKKEKLKGH